MHNTSRNCTRCGKDLTDAASMEAGIGPICRNLDNALLARLIPSNLDKAKAAFDNVDLTAVAPETLKTLNEVYGALFADGAVSREDWRLEVKRIEWALSYPANTYMRNDLTNVVAALGYIGLAALWSGEAKTGKAQVTFMNNRIVIQAAKCKAANATFRAIHGRQFHSMGTLTPKAAWSFPAIAHNAVYLAVIKHYPNFEGLTEAIEKAKKFWACGVVAAPAPTIAIDTETVGGPFGQMVVLTNQTLFEAMGVPNAVLNPAVTVITEVPPAPAPKAAPKCCIVPAGVLLKVTMAYDKVKTPAYVDELKATVKWTDRRWNPHEKCWEIVASHADTVKALITKHFGAEAL